MVWEEVVELAKQLSSVSAFMSIVMLSMRYISVIQQTHEKANLEELVYDWCPENNKVPPLFLLVCLSFANVVYSVHLILSLLLAFSSLPLPPPSPSPLSVRCGRLR